MRGSNVCVKHGARLPPARYGAQTRLVKQAIEDSIRRLNLPAQPDEDPREVLLSAVRTAHRQKQVLEAVVSALPVEDFEQLGYQTGVLGGTNAGARIEIAHRMLAEATKNAARASKLAIDAGLEERLVHLAENQATLMVAALRAAVAAMNLPKAQADEMLRLSAGELARLAGGVEVMEGSYVEVKRK